MLETNQKYDLEAKVEIEHQLIQQQKQEITLLGHLRPKKGHTLYKINLETFEVTLPKYQVEDKPFDISLREYNQERERKKVVIEKNYYYVLALNPANALRRLLKNKGSAQLGK